MLVVCIRSITMTGLIKRALIFALVASMSACGIKDEAQDCGTYLLGKPMNPSFEVNEEGLARHIESGTIFYRCAAGQAYRAGRCVGAPLGLSKIDADLFIEEFSTKSKQPWRLPTQQELKRIVVNECQNPAVDTRVFPDMPIENLWTSSERKLQGEEFQCVMYSFNGSISCKFMDKDPLPFLMVRADS
jgi:hypothetical protein